MRRWRRLGKRLHHREGLPADLAGVSGARTRDAGADAVPARNTKSSSSTHIRVHRHRRNLSRPMVGQSLQTRGFLVFSVSAQRDLVDTRYCGLGTANACSWATSHAFVAEEFRNRRLILWLGHREPFSRWGKIATRNSPQMLKRYYPKNQLIAFIRNEAAVHLQAATCVSPARSSASLSNVRPIASSSSASAKLAIPWASRKHLWASTLSSFARRGGAAVREGRPRALKATMEAAWTESNSYE
jgi:hypothetical protein